MPTVFEVRCDRCDHREHTLPMVSYVRDDAGDLVLLPHPVEAGTAEQVTGRSFRQLLDEGRIIYRAPLVCCGCGEMSEHAIGDERGFLHAITYHPTAEDIIDLRCLGCGGALRCLDYPDPQGAAIARALLVPPSVTGVALAALGSFLHDRSPAVFWSVCVVGLLGSVAVTAWLLNRAPDPIDPPAARCPRCAEGQLTIDAVGVS